MGLQIREIMMRASSGLVWLVTVGEAMAVAAAVGPFETQGGLAPQNEIDRLVFARLDRLKVQPASVCSDAVFIRRACLDVIGTLPTAKEASEFLADHDSKKRVKLIDRLLQREEFADYWAMKWSDLLRVKAEFPINLWPNAAQTYHRWIYASLKAQVPYDQFAREILTASGSNFRVPQVNFYRAVQSKDPQTIAQAVALTFMGARAERWPQDRLAGLAAFFSRVGYKSTAEWKEEIVFFDPGLTNKARAAIYPDGTRATIGADEDPREVFAAWLITPENPWFTRNIVNRTWSWLLGRGIVQPADDLRPDNPPSNPELLALLERELVAAHYDLRHIYRLILASKTYQLSSIPAGAQPEAEANFAYYPLRRLDAEVLIDALCQITGTSEKYSSAIPEPFTFIPEGQRSMALPDGSISSPFLEMFGRSPRDTGLESERNNRPTAEQKLHLLNSSHIQAKLEQSPRLRNLTQSRAPPREVVNGLYLMILSRFPTEEEWKIVSGYSPPGAAQSREGLVDLAWALINTAEFLYRH